MTIDKTSFFTALATLVAGGAGGYYAGEHGMLRTATPAGVTEQQGPLASPATGATAAATAPATPACDDTLGSPAACPAPGYPAEEGGCGALPTKRCEDFKRAMKPRVAERAVDCLNALTPAQRCDPNRLNLCAHEALMNACAEPGGSSFVAAARPTDEVTAQCDAIAHACGAVGLGPSSAECRATLAGLSAFGRDQMATCMKTHCADKGLVGCEAVIDAK